MQKFLRDPLGSGVGYGVIGINSVQFSKADPVYIDSSGWLALTTGTSKVLGYYTGKGETMTSTNQTVAFVKPQYCYALGVEMVFGSDTDCVQTDVGAYADMGTYTTGAFELDLLAGGTGQYLVLGFDPEDESDDDAVVVMCAEPQMLAFAQA